MDTVSYIIFGFSLGVIAQITDLRLSKPSILH